MNKMCNYCDCSYLCKRIKESGADIPCTEIREIIMVIIKKNVDNDEEE